METRKEIAAEKRAKGYNCAQAIGCTYCDLVGIDEKTMFKITEGLGLGMGNMEGTCGSILGAGVIVGLLNSTANLEKPDSKVQTLKMSKEIMEKFKERNTTTICKELKGTQTGKVIRSCADCVRDAAEYLEDIIESIGDKNIDK